MRVTAHSYGSGPLWERVAGVALAKQREKERKLIIGSGKHRLRHPSAPGKTQNISASNNRKVHPKRMLRHSPYFRKKVPLRASFLFLVIVPYIR